MKRVACLYRVSTKYQVDPNGDISMQKNACHEFASKQKDWEIIKEYYERGVSGFKLKAAEREILEELIESAFKHEFDVLLVFMLDRIGRRESETPFILENIVNEGIEVWSVKEGQKTFDNATDKLINFLTFWQANGESLKTSTRVTEKHTQMVKEGLMVTNAPYGYRTIPSGEHNKKGREKRKFIIIEEEANIVKLIYRLARVEGYGGFKIAKILNEKGIPTLKNSRWSDNTVNGILRNPFYMGYPAWGRSQQKGKRGRTPSSEWLLPKEQIKDLVIIPANEWEKVKEIRNSRKWDVYKEENMNYEKYRKNDKYPMNTNSKLLLMGKVYCGHCGSKLSNGSNNDTWKTKDGEIHKKFVGRYKCINRSSNGGECEGQTTYKAETIEGVVLDEIYNYLDTLEKFDFAETIILEQNKTLQEKEKEIRNLQTQIRKKELDLGSYKSEIAKAIRGESQMSLDILNEVIIQNQEDIKKIQEKISKKQNSMESYRLEQNDLIAIGKSIPIWREEFAKADNAGKKMLLAELIERVDVYKGSIKITMSVRLLDFLKNCYMISTPNVETLHWTSPISRDGLFELILRNNQLVPLLLFYLFLTGYPIFQTSGCFSFLIIPIRIIKKPDVKCQLLIQGHHKYSCWETSQSTEGSISEANK